MAIAAGKDRGWRRRARIGASAEAMAWFASGGADPGLMSPDAFADFIRTEHARWGKVIRDAGIRME